MTERWLPVVGYEGRYEVSDLGRVRSLDRVVVQTNKGTLSIRNLKGRLMTQPSLPESEHLCVRLSANGATVSRLVHNVVLEAFVGPRPGHHTQWHGCHNDGRPTNNTLNNLRWDTRSGNEMDKIAHGTSNRGVRNRANKLTEEQALEIKSRLANDNETHGEIANDYGVTREAVTAIRLGRSWSWL